MVGERKDGGPIQYETEHGDMIYVRTGWGGMSLRQFYKAHAIAGLLASCPQAPSTTSALIAGAAGEMADAAVAEGARFAERAKRDEP